MTRACSIMPRRGRAVRARRGLGRPQARARRTAAEAACAGHRSDDRCRQRSVLGDGAAAVAGEPGAANSARSPRGEALGRQELAAERLYSAPSVVERLLAGQRVLAQLLDELAPVVEPLEAVGVRARRAAGRARSIACCSVRTYAARTRFEALLGDHRFPEWPHRPCGRLAGAPARGGS